MWPRTARFDASLARSGTRFIRAELLRDGQVVDPGTPLQVLDGGQVNVDRQVISRDLTVPLLDVGGALLPISVDDPLAPVVAELRIWCGTRYYDATPAEQFYGRDTEYVPAGTFVLTGFDGRSPELTVTGFDRGWHLGEFEDDYAAAAGKTRDALIALLQSQVPATVLAYSIPENDAVTGPLFYEAGSSSADAAHAMALAMGLRLYVDPMGVFVADVEPSITDPPVAVYEPGPLSMMLRPQRSIQAESFTNAVLFTGESPTGVAVKGYAEDSDPESLTYAPRVGRRVRRETSPLVRTPAQAQLAANTSLIRDAGIPDSVTVPSLWNPALASGDVLQARDPLLRIDFPVIADSFTLPLGPGEQPIRCRQRVVR